MKPPCPKPEMIEYEKMQQIGVRQFDIIRKMKIDGIDPYWICDFFGELVVLPQSNIDHAGKGPKKKMTRANHAAKRLPWYAMDESKYNLKDTIWSAQSTELE